MRRLSKCVVTLLAAGCAAPASAGTVVILTDPMTMERRAVVIDEKGPDRVLLCAMPPSNSGCREISRRRAR